MASDSVYRFSETINHEITMNDRDVREIADNIESVINDYIENDYDVDPSHVPVNIRQAMLQEAITYMMSDKFQWSEDD